MWLAGWRLLPVRACLLSTPPPLLIITPQSLAPHQVVTVAQGTAAGVSQARQARPRRREQWRPPSCMSGVKRRSLKKVRLVVSYTHCGGGGA